MSAMFSFAFSGHWKQLSAVSRFAWAETAS